MQSQAPLSVMSPGVVGVFWDVGTSDVLASGDPAEVDQASACVLAVLDSDLASLSGTTWWLSWFCCWCPPSPPPFGYSSHEQRQSALNFPETLPPAPRKCSLEEAWIRTRKQWSVFRLTAGRSWVWIPSAPGLPLWRVGMSFLPHVYVGSPVTPASSHIPVGMYS